jgi:hypothetical protein
LSPNAPVEAHYLVGRQYLAAAAGLGPV